MNSIDQFKGEHAFLSNFYSCPLRMLDGLLYRTAEHAFQAMKVVGDPKAKEEIRKARNPNEAKRLGRKVKLRPAWDSIRIDVMRQVVRAKFQNPELQRKLLETGDRKLIEGNNWGDSFWGVCGGKGENWLGKILMDLREEIRQN